MRSANESRDAEGQHLSDALETHLRQLGASLSEIRERVPEILIAHRTHLNERAQQLELKVDPARLEAEIALLAERLDVQEEIVRLGAHLSRARDVLRSTEPIGKELEINDRTVRIIGVVRDFHYASLHDAIGPLIIRLQTVAPEYLCIKIAGDDITGSIDHIRRQWEMLVPGEEFRHRFFEDLLGREYNSDVRTGNIVLGFTILAVLVAGLGLFGLAAFSAGRRRKEIGIRKVHGASVSRLVGLVGREYIVLILISSVIAGPIAFLVMNDWLHGFAYRIQVGWGHFLVSTLAVLTVSAAAVSYQALRAATTNPASTLRHE